jgi:hypothetical protein
MGSPESWTTSSGAASPSSDWVERLKEDLLAFAGVWRDLDAERMIADIYRARREALPSPSAEL